MGRFSIALSKFLKQNDLGFYELHSLKGASRQEFDTGFTLAVESLAKNEALIKNEGSYNKGLPAKTLKTAQAGHVELYKSGKLYLGDPKSAGQFLPIFELLRN